MQDGNSLRALEKIRKKSSTLLYIFWTHTTLETIFVLFSFSKHKLLQEFSIGGIVSSRGGAIQHFCCSINYKTSFFCREFHIKKCKHERSCGQPLIFKDDFVPLLQESCLFIKLKNVGIWHIRETSTGNSQAYSWLNTR